MSQTLDLIMSARNTTDAAFKQMQAGLGGVETKLKTIVPATDAWSNAQQRAALRMEGMHEAALKMNTGLGTTDDKAQRLSSTIHTMSGTLTSSAAAMGMPIGQLGALNSAADIAGMGMGKLQTTMVGFNVASFAVAGAGLAVGAALGTWLRTFPAIAKAADDAAAALVRLFTAQKDIDAAANATAGLAKFQAEMAAKHVEAQKRQVEAMKAAGMSIGQIVDTLEGKHKTASETYIEGLKREEAGLKKFNAEQEKAAELAAKVAEKVAQSISNAKVTWTGFATMVPNSIRPAEAAVIDLTEAVVDLEAAAKAARLANEALWREIDKVSGAIIASNVEAWGMVEEAERATENVIKLGDVLRSLPGILDQLGVSADSALGQLAEGFAGAAEGAMALFQGLASGNPAQIIQGIAGIGHAMKGLSESTNGWVRAAGIIINAPLGLAGLIFGGGGPSAADRLNHDLMIMRTEFINSAGGLVALEAAAADAGVSLDAMWNARTVEEYEAAIGRVNAAIALHEEAVDLTKAAMDRWGVSIDQLGPALAGQFLEDQLLKIYQDFMLLTEGGRNVALATELMGSDMGAALSKLIQDAITTGAALPLALQPWIEELARSGRLIDENGQAITDVSNLTFTETLEAGVTRLIDKLEEWLDALLGIPRKIEVEWAYKVTGPRPPGVPGGPTVPGEPGDGPAEHAHGGFIERDRDWEMPGTGGGQLAIVHPGELVIPAGSDFSSVMAALTGRGRGGRGRDSAATAIAELTAAIKQQGSPVQVNVAVPVDGSTVPSAHRQQFIEGVGDEVARGFLAGGRNYRTILRAIRSANAQTAR